MVLRGKLRGRVGSRRDYFRKPAQSFERAFLFFARPVGSMLGFRSLLETKSPTLFFMQIKFIRTSLLVVSLMSVMNPVLAQNSARRTVFKVDYEKFALANGLQVIFHIDRSDPVVAVALTAHVGSAREKAGRTGFAHLFEHLLFLESENLGKGGLDKMSARIGGSGRQRFHQPGSHQLFPDRAQRCVGKDVVGGSR